MKKKQTKDYALINREIIKRAFARQIEENYRDLEGSKLSLQSKTQSSNVSTPMKGLNENG